MKRFFITIISGILGLWLATKFIPGVELMGSWKTLAFIGLILGLVNFFIKPILKLVTLPLQMLTLGLFGLIINMAMLWAVDVFFKELIIKGVFPLLWTTLIIWGLGLFLPLFFQRRKRGI